MDRYLVLENGKVFRGKALGADKEVIAEVVFTTAMTGFFETLTDKSYHGQAVVQTFPLIGNYGVIPEDAECAEDAVCASAYIVREWCDSPSNFRSEETLDEYLKKKGIPGLCGIDTRALTRMIRKQGVMNGMICDDPAHADHEKIRDYRVIRPTEEVTVSGAADYEPDGFIEVPGIENGSEDEYKKLRDAASAEEKDAFHIVLIDMGFKESIAKCLWKRGAKVRVVPAKTAPEDILALQPDGIVISNGPGDPTDNPEVIENLRTLCASGVPIMGICLGHQLLALTHGFSTYKLKYGHRGANQPVRCTKNGRTYISSQNHGYAVKNESIDPKIAGILFENVNDLTNEGLFYRKEPVFSVQFHPEAGAGPHDTEFLFDEFLDTVRRSGAERAEGSMHAAE